MKLDLAAEGWYVLATLANSMIVHVAQQNLAYPIRMHLVVAAAAEIGLGMDKAIYPMRLRFSITHARV